MLSSGKYMSALVALFYLREEMLEQNLVRKPLLLTLMTTLLQCNNCYSRYVHSRSQVTFLTNSVWTIHHRGITSLMGLQKQDTATTREGKVQDSLRIGSCLRQSLILIRFTDVVANFIYLVERDGHNLR